MKRFWKIAEADERPDGWGIALDGRPLKTPARADLILPTVQLAEAVRSEWEECGEQIDPRGMPLTGLANSATDHPSAALADSLARYAEADLLCYRATSPDKLVKYQATTWDPQLAWARRRYDVDFVVTSGVIHVPQPSATVARLGHAVHALDPFRLAALSPLVTIGGSLVAALALLEEAFTVDAAWDGVSLDEQWQIEQWGADAEAVAALAGRRSEFESGARFLSLL